MVQLELGWMTFAPEWLTGSPNLDTSNWMYTYVPCLILCPLPRSPSARCLNTQFPNAPQSEKSISIAFLIHSSTPFSSQLSSTHLPLFLSQMRCPCICAGGRRRRPTFHNTDHTATLATNTSTMLTNTQMGVSLLLQRTVGRLSALDHVRSVPGDELGYESDGDGGFGELLEEGRLKLCACRNTQSNFDMSSRLCALSSLLSVQLLVADVTMRPW